MPARTPNIKPIGSGGLVVFFAAATAIIVISEPVGDYLNIGMRAQTLKHRRRPEVDGFWQAIITRRQV
jgi:hypothetical protein